MKWIIGAALAVPLLLLALPYVWFYVWFFLLTLVASLSAEYELFGFLEWNWHQELTVSVQTPEGIKSGSAVRAATFKLIPDWANLTGHGSSSGLSGEAVVVDLGEERYIFALLETNFFPRFEVVDLFFPALDQSMSWGGELEPFYDQMETLRATAEVPPERYPLLVTFEDIEDPASVQRVDPADLAASFGPGYSLEAITISITDEPVTRGEVEKVLPWLNEYYDIHFDGNTIETIEATNRFANSLAAGAFDTERN